MTQELHSMFLTFQRQKGVDFRIFDQQIIVFAFIFLKDKNLEYLRTINSENTLKKIFDRTRDERSKERPMPRFSYA